MHLPALLNDKSLCKVRTITVFLRLEKEQSQWFTSIKGANKFCQSLASDFKNNGYTVQTVRIVTNPFAEYIDTSSLKTAQKDLRHLNQLIKNRCNSLTF